MLILCPQTTLKLVFCLTFYSWSRSWKRKIWFWKTSPFSPRPQPLLSCSLISLAHETESTNIFSLFLFYMSKSTPKFQPGKYCAQNPLLNLLLFPLVHLFMSILTLIGYSLNHYIVFLPLDLIPVLAILIHHTSRIILLCKSGPCVDL